MKKKAIKILSIDGGGIRGVVPLQIIKHIENLTGKEIHHSFDLIAGTSTGGLLTCALTYPDRKNTIGQQRMYSLKEIEEIYTKRGTQIFPTTSFTELKKWFYPKHKHKNLCTILDEFFFDSRITSCMKPIFISSYDIHRNRPVYFNFREASQFYEKNVKLFDICRATSAAPTYFASHQFEYAGESITCVDGGVFMNNPALGALVEVLENSKTKYYGGQNDITLNDIYLLSIGTGRSTKLLNSAKSAKWGSVQWIKPLIDITTNGPVQAIHNQLETIFKTFNCKENYLRINFNLKTEFSEMSDTRPETLGYLINQANSQIETNYTLMRKLKVLLENCGIL